MNTIHQNKYTQAVKAPQRKRITFGHLRKSAQKDIVKFLNKEKPLEATVILESNTKNIGQFIGDNDEIKLPLGIINQMKKSGNKIAILHGHTPMKSNEVLPLSMTDLILAASSNVSELIALDKNGNHSTLEITSPKGLIGNNLNEIVDNWKTTVAFNDVSKDELEMLNKDQRITKMIEEQNKSGYAEKLHHFWQRIAKEFNMKYSTNFPGLD